MSNILKKPVKLALIQIATGVDKSVNLAHARVKVREAVHKYDAKIVILPECFNSPYGSKYFRSYAEVLCKDIRSRTSQSLNSNEKVTSETLNKEAQKYMQVEMTPTRHQDRNSADGSPTYNTLANIARETKTYLIGGSIPEYDPSTKRIYNTSLTFAPSGELLGTHRKAHLFDIDIPGKIRFKESEVLSPGDSLTLIDLPEYGKIAVAICYDIRFPEMAMIAARKGAFLLLYPGAFNMTTGPLHWELQARARAMDNQVYVGLCSPARDLQADYHAWGHSMIVDPNASILAEAAENEAIVEAQLDPAEIERVRKAIPLSTQRRFDIYPDISRSNCV